MNTLAISDTTMALHCMERVYANGIVGEFKRTVYRQRCLRNALADSPTLLTESESMLTCYRGLAATLRERDFQLATDLHELEKLSSLTLLEGRYDAMAMNHLLHDLVIDSETILSDAIVTDAILNNLGEWSFSQQIQDIMELETQMQHHMLLQVRLHTDFDPFPQISSSP